MKTKVTIQRGMSGNYHKLVIKVLKPRYEGSNYLTPIGQFTWQGDDRSGWYAFQFEVEGYSHDHTSLLTMYKLMCYINERASDHKPEEVLAIIGAEEHQYIGGMYVSVNDNGKYIYEVKKFGDTNTYTSIIAASEVIAERIVAGMIAKGQLTDGVSWRWKPRGERLALTLTNVSYK